MSKNKKKILIIDDEKLGVKAIFEHLTSEGYEVYDANDGRGGLEKAKKIKPSIILLDIIMPVMDGLTVLKKLKENSGTKNIPVLVLTNLETDESVREAVKSGSREYLVKANYGLNDLSKKIESVLNNR